MYLNPLTQFVRSLVTGNRSFGRRVRRPRRDRQQRRANLGSWSAFVSPAELLEERAMLSGPQLVSVVPNTGGFIYNGTPQNATETEAPKELTFTFSPGASIDSTTLSGISISRAGGDNTFGNANDQAIAPGFVGVAVAGLGNNQVTLRFAQTLPDDLYRITITGDLKSTASESFNNGITQTVDFRVDYGAQVTSLVPQPILRTENLNVLSFSSISDLDTFSITAGSAPVTFQFKNTGTASQMAQGNIAVNYSSADTATTLATKIAAAVNSAFSASGAVSATPGGSKVSLAGAAFTPAVKITTAQSGALSISDGGLVQKQDTIVAYFNQDPLNPTLAQDPGFYQVINTADGSLLLPQKVTYDSVTNTAVLKFASNLPAGTFQLQIGAPNLTQNTLGTAVNAGTLFSNTGGYSINGFLGNANHLGNSQSDVDLYRFNASAATTVTINASDLSAGLGSNVSLRLFDANGVQLATSGTNSIAFNLAAAGTYYVGVSSSGNTTYSAVTGTGATNGAGFGSYNLSIAVSNALALNSDTTSFSTATNLGTLGAAGQSIGDAIAPLGTLAYPTLPGGPDEPGHRDIEDVVPGESNAGVPLGTYVPGVSRIYYYNFQDVYGTDPQGNTLHNAITDEQKQLAREIFAIYASYLGVEFVETANTGYTIVTGDVRAASPGLPPDSVGGVYRGNLVIVNANAVPGGSSQYGGAWFNIAFHEVGHSLRLEHSYDAPGVMGQGVGPGTGVEGVYPGDVDLVAAENLNPAQSTDINLYQFQLTQAGTFSAQTIAQRRTDSNGNADPSLLDSVLTLYQDVNGVRTIVARNDDYFGKDSFINLHLGAGTYYLAVTSTGNTSFDPTVADTGFGGRTDGAYRLKLDFKADPPATATLTDQNGSALDGDGNAMAGGVFNFWFQSNTAANTIYVDKTNAADVSQNGTIAHAYSTISAALAAATPGTVVRIVGNGGTDGDPTTLADDTAYQIGFDTQNNVAADGADFKIPKGVTVMIDAGAIIKLRGAVIDVGDSVPNVDRSGSALQVLGTPGNNVYFTSLRNNAIGGNTDPTNFTGAQNGNWGGLVFRQASDVQGKNYAGNGIFLNSVNQANITYGGGQVLEDSVLQVFDPIHISNPDPNARFFARPAIWNNTITNSADAAISADPNSFYNSLDRVGPDIHGNTVTNNTINGLFIRIRTDLGESIDKLGVSARLDDSDIAYVLTENLLIDGNPGGPSEPDPSDPTHTGWNARLAGSLIVDPGIILKMNGARIEAQVGDAQIIAEGSAIRPIIFTSLKDDTYGAGGTFDTGADGASTGSAGDYGGLFFNSGTSGSIDQARILFGGGTTPIAGGFTQFNPVEIQQAHVRVTNTLFQNNADGVTGEDQDPSNGNRNGLLPNTGLSGTTGPSTIFVRGAQPIIVKNTFVDNAGNVISINANALNSLQVADWGRSTGTLGAYTDYVNNYGPLVRLNAYTGNGTNGMEVRGESITTETIWDDTDIVHVVRDEIHDDINLHTYDGIRLQSSSDASLVVKLSGADAGFTANGTPLDISDRIGGTVQIIGSPGHPVYLTALEDDTVGAGFDPSGQPQNDTNNDGISTDKPLTFPPSTGPLAVTTTTSGQTLLNAMVIRQLASGVTLSNASYTGGSVAAGTYKNGGNVPLGIYPTGALITTGNAAIPASNTETNFGLAMNTPGDPRLDALIADTGFKTTEASTLTFTVNVAPGSGIHSGRFNFVFGSEEYPEFVNSSYNDVVGAFVNGGASTNVLHDSKGNLISINSSFFDVDNTNDSLNVEYDGLTKALAAAFPLHEGTNTVSISIGDVSDRILDSGIFLTDLRFSTDTVGTGGVTSVPAPGAWRSIDLEQYSNDTNMAVYLESEQIANQPNTNGTPATAELLGNLAPDAVGNTPDNNKGGNTDQPLGFEIHGYLNSRADVDVYSFKATAGTEVWFDIGRTSPSLDTVLELVDASGNVLASSDNSMDNSTLGGIAMPLIKDSSLGGDFYTTNPKDAGFRAILPGAAGANGTYFIKVHSKNAQTMGEYQLQVRTQQVYQHPGSTVQFADIRYAANGIEVHGLPDHSPLAGSSASVGTNANFGSAQALGNLLTSDQNTISVAGSLASSSQVDWYKFTVNYDLIQAIGGVNGADKTWATIFDIDYADGLARPDLTLSVFDAKGNLILVSRNSSVNDDQPTPLSGTGLTDLSGGSVGKLDPYVGTVMMPAGTPASVPGPENGNSDTTLTGTPKTYYVAISSNTWLPTALDGTFISNSANSKIRLEPVDSVQRIVEDHIGFTGYMSGSNLTGSAPVQPTSGPILPVATSADLGLTVRPLTLSDVVLYTTNNPGGPFTQNTLVTIDPYDGTAETTIKQLQSPDIAQISDLQFRADGLLYGYQSIVGPTGDDTKGKAGQLVLIDPATGVETPVGMDGIPDLPNPLTPPINANDLTTNTVNSFTWITNTPWGVSPQYDLLYSVQDTGGFWNSGHGASRLYLANPTSGSAAHVDGQPWGVINEIVRSVGDSGIGFTTGMAWLNNTLYGVSTGGLFYTIDPNSGHATQIADFSGQGLSFAGLTLGPQNLDNGAYKNMLFAITSGGSLVALNTSGQLQPVFANGATSIQTGVSNPQGIAFSPLDFNLWHPTMQQSTAAGHGINATFDNSRPTEDAFKLSIDGQDSDMGQGGASFYFGLENWVSGPTTPPSSYLTYNGVDAQYGVLTSDYQQFLTGNPASQIGNNYNLPGGAYGSLVTKSFSLAGYSNTDLPTLYFNYLLDTDKTNSPTAMQDSARVFVSTDGGTTWSLAATNNSVRSTPGNGAELPQYTTATASETFAGNQGVQELFDDADPTDSTTWRQARVDLSAYAGQPNVQLRFDFSTAGAMISNNAKAGLPGDSTGVGPQSTARAVDNNHLGFYIDDIIVGLAGRGEMVTGNPAANPPTTFFAPNPGIESDPTVPKQQLTGPYQLEIRRGTAYGGSTNGTSSTIAIFQQFDVNDRLAPGFSINATPGGALTDGQTFLVSDGVKSVTFEFDSNNSITSGNRSVPFTTGDTNITVARSIRDAINSAASAGLFSVTASLADGTVTGSNSTNPRVDLFGATQVTSIQPVQDVTVAINKTSISENSGSATGTVSIPQPLGTNLTVSLAVINPATGLPATDVTIPATATILAGQTSVNFAITGVNDALFNGTRTIIIQPTAAGFSGVSYPLDVTDDDAGALVLTINNNVSGLTEGSTRTATVTRNSPTTQALLVSLASLNPGEVSVPASVLIPVGQSSATFTFTAVQDGLIDGDRSATLEAWAPSYSPGTDSVLVLDSGVNTTLPSITVGSNVDITKLAGNQTGGTIAVDRTNSNRLFMASSTADGTGLVGAYSTDGGQTWTTRSLATGADGLPAGLRDPSVAADEFGNLFLTYVASDGKTVIVAASTDFGQSFTQLTSFTNTTGVDQPTIAAAEFDTANNKGSVWVTWRDQQAGMISAAGAQTTGLGAVAAFGGAQTVPYSDNWQFGSIAIGPSGQVMVAYQTTATVNGPNDILASVDSDGLGAGGFSAIPLPITSTNVGSLEKIPAQNQRGVDAEVEIAWDRTGGPHNGRVYAVYTSETPNASGNTDIYLRYSDNTGGTWSSPVKINDDSTANSQFLPQLAIDQTTGNLAITWYDARNDFAGQGTVSGLVSSGSGGLSKPSGMALGPDGNLYVASSATNQILRFNGTTGTFMNVFVAAGAGGLQNPSGITFGPDGALYVSSFDTDQVLRYNGTTGAFTSAFVSAAAGGLDGPGTLVFGTDNFLYVVSQNTDNVLRYTANNGSFDKIFVAAGTGGLNTPSGMTFGPDGNLYVGSRGTSSILRFNGTSGALIDAFVPANTGGLAFPTSLQFGPDKNLYVSSDLFGNILRFNGSSGAFIDTYVASGTGLNLPTTLLWRPDGTLAVTDAGTDSVARVTTQIGGAGDTDGITNDDAQYWGAVASYINGALVVNPNFQISAGASNSKSSGSSLDFGPYTGLDFNQGRMYPLWADNSTALASNPDRPKLDQASAVVDVNPSGLAGLVTVTINAASISENGGATTGTLSLVDTNGNPIVVSGQPLVVSLTPNIAGAANLPPTVTIPTGQSSASFNISAVNNTVAGGKQTLIINPTLAGYEGVGAGLAILDDETPALSLTVGPAALEGSVLTATVTRNTPITSPLTVYLYSTDTTEATVPLSVVIPAGELSATFSINAVEDFQLDGDHFPTIVAAAPGMASAEKQIAVLDSGTSGVDNYNDRFHIGDLNTTRPQGVINISSNTISNVANTAILVSSPPRDAGSANLPHPGSVLNGPTLNSDNLVPGPQISNNVIYNFGQTGIQFSGDPNAAGNPLAAAPYGRIVNNTIYGGATARGTGILVSNNAAPTLLNNIIANTSTGISVDSSSASRTVVGTELFQGNTNNGSTFGTNPIFLTAGQPLFINPATGNFYLAPGSLAIDSSLNTLGDRPSIAAVESPLGIPQSPITAPRLDRYGQLRLDDPTAANASGLGQNIFKDRGAVERADFSGPTANLLLPLDNSLGDGDPSIGTYFLITPTPLTEFEIQLTDQGIGIDNATVSSAAFVLKQDGVTLVDGVDYVFSYNANTHVAAFKSISVFPAASTYTINLDTTVLKDTAGNALQGNQPDGTSLFTIIGNAPPTLSTVAVLPGLRNVTNDISYATLLANSDLKVTNTHTADFQIYSVVAGTLTISKGANPPVAVIPGTTLVEAGDVLHWTPPIGAENQTAAFTVVGYDPQNAAIAPALSTSSFPVTVSLNLVNVPPKLTTISTLPTDASEDTPYFITYTQLKGQSDLNDQNNDSPLSFLISEITTGTLQISDNGGSYVAVIPGSTVFGPGDILKWQAPANQNNVLNGNNPFNAFKVLATDGQATSALPAVQVKINVDPVPDAPIMTSLTPFGLGGLNSPFAIAYADLVSHSDVQNVDGHAIQFRIESLATGSTLQIKHNGVVSTVVPGTATAIVSAGDTLFWTPPAGVFGNNTPAFNVVAYDDFNATSFPTYAVSSPQLTAGVNVINKPSPTLTTIVSLTRPEFVPSTITFADLQAASNVTIPSGDTLGFRIESITSGALQITHNGSTTTVVPGTTIALAGDTLTWTSAPNATGSTPAFKVLAVDLTTTLISADPVQAVVNLVNVAPTLTGINTLQTALQQTPFTITFDTLKNASNAQDVNNDPIGFRIDSVTSGDLRITHNGVTSGVSQGVTVFTPGDTLTWTPANGVTGASVAAFKVSAFDGLVASSTSVQVNVNVVTFGTGFNLTGPWVVNGQLARINQNGGTLTFVDQNGTGSSGGFTGTNTVTGRNNLTATIDNSTADTGRILWSDGSIWLRIALGGQYYNTGNNGLTAVTQNGMQLTFVNVAGGTTPGTFTSATQISIPGWGQTVSFADGTLSFSAGSSWKKLDLSPDYRNATGDALHIIQNGTALTFVNKAGGTSPGKWISPTQVQATNWGVTGTVANGTILWSNNSVWYKNLVAYASGGGSGLTSVTATDSQIILTNKSGGASRAQITGANTLIALDWGGVTGTRSNGKILWSNGTVWDNFDFNALDAVFSDIRQYPFGS
jgi:hypothetical protein